MNWKLLLMAMGLVTFVSCGGGPKSDAERLCDCGRDIVKMMNDLAPESELEAKSEECEKIGDEIEEKYKNDEEAMREFEAAFESCAEEVEDDIEAAEEKYEDAMDKH